MIGPLAILEAGDLISWKVEVSQEAHISRRSILFRRVRRSKHKNGTGKQSRSETNRYGRAHILSARPLSLVSSAQSYKGDKLGRAGG